MHVGGKEEVSADFRDQVPFRFCLIHGRRPLIARCELPAARAACAEVRCFVG